jgi:hypothetical protein
MASTGAVVLAQPFTVYCVGENNDSAHSGGFAGSQGGLAGIMYQTSPAQDLQIYAGSPLAATAVVSSKCAMCGVFGGASSASYVNNSQVSVASGNAGANNMSGTFGLFGSSGAPATLMGKLPEVIAYSGAHSAAQRLQVFSYFGSRYGIATS